MAISASPSSTVGASRDAPPIRLDLAALRPGDARRLVEIALTFARHGVVVVVRRGPSLLLRPRQMAPRTLAVALRRAFVDLGPTFVKFGQLIASSPGLFPEVVSDEMRRLLDALPAEPAARVRSVLERDLGATIEDLFAFFDDHAVAAASIAQVHEARLHDGTRVAVKVRRPRLRPRIERDLRLMCLLATAVDRATRIGDLADLRGIVEDFAVTIDAELDLRNEAAAMAAFAANLARDGHTGRIVVPRPIDGMVTPRVLVMTWVDGQPIDRAAAAADEPGELLDVALEAMRVWLEGALRHGLFHGDAHAGNLFIDPPSTVAFLDFGIMGTLDPALRTTLTRTLPAAIGPIVLQQRYELVHHVVAELGVSGGDLDEAGLVEGVKGLLGTHLSRPLSAISYGDIVVDVIRLATNHHLRLPRALVLVAKQALYFERYAKEIAPDINVFEQPDVLRRLLDGLVDPTFVDALPLILAMVAPGGPAPTDGASGRS